MPEKCILVLLDGAGDRSHGVLDGKTPLQAARTPFLDGLAARGANGLYHAGMLGQAMPSENAHFAIFGYPLAEFPGRGALEALGAGLDLGPDHVAVLAHFCSARAESGKLRLVLDRPGATEQEARELVRAVASFEAEGVRVTLHHTKGLFGVLLLQGAVSRHVTDSNTMRDDAWVSRIAPWQDYEGDPDALRTARVLTKYVSWAHRTLDAHPVNAARTARGEPPVNGLVTQRAGRMGRVDPFEERYGLKGLVIASGVVFAGLAAYLGMDFGRAEDTGDPGADLAWRMEWAAGALDDYDFVHVHTKAPDEAAHTKDPVAKRDVLEALDAGLDRSARGLLDDPRVLLAATADHSTPSDGPLVHSGEAVPLAMAGRGVRRDGVERFDEVSAALGCLGAVRGPELMLLALNHLEKARMAGIVDAPRPTFHWPGPYEPFILE